MQTVTTAKTATKKVAAPKTATKKVATQKVSPLTAHIAVNYFATLAKPVLTLGYTPTPKQCHAVTQLLAQRATRNHTTGQRKQQAVNVARAALAVQVQAAQQALTALLAQQAQQNSAAQQAAKQAGTVVTMPSIGTAVQQAAKAGFTRIVQNGRGNYTPNSIGALIWQTATALQALTPLTPITSAAVKLALPHVKPASVSAGLSHWRKFNGTMRIKGQVTPTVPATV